ncbi:TonB-dependent receptor [Pseudohalioglobus sediminis]|nr:TonB-dependent receptor [Pseudohalioglobus sediminis]
MKTLSRSTLLAIAVAAPGAYSAEELEEIVVTADFRQTQLMTSAASVSVLGELQFEERGAQHLEDVLSAAPNVSWSTGASRSRFIQMRGVGDLEQYAEPKYYPSVGVIVDDLELGSAANAGMLFDVSQVEVLRGPQGTRFGASAHAGLVKISSKAPTDEFEAQLSGGVGNYGSYRYGGVVSGPLGEQVSGRIAVQQNKGDGYLENRALGRDDSNGYDEVTARGRLLWRPSDTASYDLAVFSFNADNGYDAYSLDNDRNSWADQPGADEQDTLAFTAKGAWQLGNSSLQATATHLDADLYYGYDADWVSPELCARFTCSGGFDTAQEIFERDRTQDTLEVRWLGGGETLDRGDLRYVAGLYANRNDEDLDYAYPSAWFGLYESSSRYQTERYALYGELEYGLSDRLSVSGGVRVERFEDDYRDSNGVAHDNSDDLYNGELSLQYDLSDNSFLYATLALASKPGGVNVAASSQFAFMSPEFQGFMQGNLRFDSESLFNREVGYKTRQFDGRLALRTALFYTTRDAAQLESWMWDESAGLWIGYLDSGSDATAYGLELESSFDLTASVQLFANLGWLETEVDEINTYDLDAGDFVSKRDREQSKSPGYQYSVGVRARFPAGFSGAIEAEGRDESYFGYYHDGKLDSYDLFNANLTWSNGDITVNLWGRNLSDEDYATHGLYFGADPRDDFGAWSNQSYYQLGAPRTYGLDVSWWL